MSLPMKIKCACTLAISVLGDGCRYCQPQEYIDRTHEQMADEQVERDAALALLCEANVPDCEPQDYKDTLVDFVLPNGDEGYDLTEASLKKSKGEK